MDRITQLLKKSVTEYNSKLWEEYWTPQKHPALSSTGADAATCDRHTMRDTPSVSGNMWSHHTDLWEIESLIMTSPDPDSCKISIPQMQSNLAASPANSSRERTLFDFVPCNVSAILIDENSRGRLRDVSRLGVRVISKVLCVVCMILVNIHTEKQELRISNWSSSDLKCT